MNDNELITVDDRVYVSPDVSLQETNEFINNLRQTQQSGVAEIEQQTRDLGSDLPPSQGGLGGASGAFVSRYQTPVVSAAVADLRAAAQATALSTALQNEIAQKKQQYNNAYKAAKKRAQQRALASSAAASTKTVAGGSVKEEESENGEAWGTIRSGPPGTTVIGNGIFNPTTGEQGTDYYDINSGDRIGRYYASGKTNGSNGAGGGGW